MLSEFRNYLFIPNDSNICTRSVNMSWTTCARYSVCTRGTEVTQSFPLSELSLFLQKAGRKPRPPQKAPIYSQVFRVSLNQAMPLCLSLGGRLFDLKATLWFWGPRFGCQGRRCETWNPFPRTSSLTLSGPAGQLDLFPMLPAGAGILSCRSVTVQSELQAMPQGGNWAGGS